MNWKTMVILPLMLLTGIKSVPHSEVPTVLPTVWSQTPVAQWEERARTVQKATAAEQQKRAEQARLQACAFTDEEAEMMAYVVQQEVRGATLAHKRIIAQMIVNRVRDDGFPDTIADVLQQPGQFPSVENYTVKRYPPDADTRQAVAEVLHGQCEDFSQGALFFYAPRWTAPETADWFEKARTFLFEMEGHRFFR